MTCPSISSLRKVHKIDGGWGERVELGKADRQGHLSYSYPPPGSQQSTNQLGDMQ